MSTTIYICGLFISVNALPDPVIFSYYEKYYNCSLNSINKYNIKNHSDISKIPEQFPSDRKLWTIFTVDQINSKIYKEMINKGVKPGILIPQNFMSPLVYLSIKQQVDQGAIPILDLSSVEPTRFSSLATLATSAGLRPMGAYVKEGWNPILKVLPEGLYIVQANDGQIPLPARLIKTDKHQFYTSYTHSYGFNGTGIILNPKNTISNTDIEYPELGISWEFLNIQFNSRSDQIHTTILGHLLLFIGLIIIPFHIILSTHYPEILGILGTSTSWLSVFVIIILITILVITILFRKFKKS